MFWLQISQITIWVGNHERKRTFLAAEKPIILLTELMIRWGSGPDFQFLFFLIHHSSFAFCLFPSSAVSVWQSQTSWVIYVWQYETNSVIMSRGNWIGVSGWELALHLERGRSDVLCWICWSVSLPATLNHGGGQEEKGGKGERGRGRREES